MRLTQFGGLAALAILAICGGGSVVNAKMVQVDSLSMDAALLPRSGNWRTFGAAKIVDGAVRLTADETVCPFPAHPPFNDAWRGASRAGGRWADRRRRGWLRQDACDPKCLPRPRICFQSQRGSVWAVTPAGGIGDAWEVDLHFRIAGTRKQEDFFGDGLAFWYTKASGVEGPGACV